MSLRIRMKNEKILKSIESMYRLRTKIIKELKGCDVYVHDDYIERLINDWVFWGEEITRVEKFLDKKKAPIKGPRLERLLSYTDIGPNYLPNLVIFATFSNDLPPA